MAYALGGCGKSAEDQVPYSQLLQRIAAPSPFAHQCALLTAFFGGQLQQRYINYNLVCRDVNVSSEISVRIQRLLCRPCRHAGLWLGLNDM